MAAPQPCNWRHLVIQKYSPEGVVTAGAFLLLIGCGIVVGVVFFGFGINGPGPDFHLNADELQRRVELTQPFELGEALRAFYSLYAARFGKPRWGDKTPAYAEHMLAIERLLPEARFIHVLRDGRDVALSLRDVWFGPASIEEAATQWCERIQAARRQATGVGAYLEIRYEDLVRDTESVLRRVCEFIELPWSESMLE